MVKKNALTSVFVLAGGLLLVSILFSQESVSTEVSAPENESATDQDSTINDNNIPLEIGGAMFDVTIADTPEKRKQGLSGTAFLPENTGKLFIFDTSDTYSFWMKDMNYAIDIFWLDDAKTIVHIAQSVSPDTYPTSFVPSKPARYVLETNAGVADSLGVKVGDTVRF
jgi:uncharacterized membrane protein (UPF0127 family)